MTGPLAGVRVLDLTSVIMGPMATQILGDLGADVVSVEDPKGDTNRVMGPGPHRQLSGVSLNLLRNKRNIALDLKSPAQRAVLDKLIERSDVFVTNLRPAPLRRLGLSYDEVRSLRPDVIYCQAHGFPSDSPQADAPAYDDIVQAATGLADAIRRVDGRPGLVPSIVADKVCALTITYSIVAALYHRAVTGEGQRIEVPMVDVMTAFVLTEHASGATARPPQQQAGYPRILTPHRRPQQTADGWVGMLPYTEAHWASLFRDVGRDDLADDPRIKSGRARIANSDFLYQELAKIVVTQTTSHWLEVCERLGIPGTAVPTLDDLVDPLPEAVHPQAGRYKVIPPPVRFSATPASVRRPAPLIGADTDEILAELGMTRTSAGLPEPAADHELPAPVADPTP